MGKLLKSKRHTNNSFQKHSAFSQTIYPILLTSLATKEQANFAALARRPGFAMRTANRVAYGAGRAYGATSRLARKGFNVIRTRIPKGIKRGIKGIAKRAVSIVSRVRRPRLALPGR